MDARPGSTDEARRIVDAFARRTGLEGSAAPRRYLWTDAFAVCVCLGLHRRTGDGRHLDRARVLVDRVHQGLGRFGPDDSRQGWISGLSEAEGKAHPTIGGLRIGKPLPERRPGEPLDDRLEWDRDGQYFHYLTRWMHALDRMARGTGDTRYHRWAAELARTAVDRFTMGAGPTRRLAWKMSVALDRPLVPSSGQHDPLDGLVTLLGLATSPARDADAPDLADEIARLSDLVRGGTWATDDALGTGGLLCDVLRLAEIVAAGGAARAALLERTCGDALWSLTAVARANPLARSLDRRLPFRELGLALGLRAVERLERSRALRTAVPRLAGMIEAMAGFAPLAEAVERAWIDPAARRSPTWVDHEDINAIMLAASLVPEGVLG